MSESSAPKALRPEVYTPEEMDALLKTCSRRAPTGVRNKALLVVGYRAGLRISEALALRPSDVDLKEGHVYVRHGKGPRSKCGKPRKVGLDAQACAIVEQWMAVRKGLAGVKRSSPLFCTLDGGPMKDAYVRAMLGRYGKRAGIEKRLHFHGLRHTYAWELCKEGVPVATIQRLLGHASLETTAVYLAHLAPHDLIAVAHQRPPWGTAR